MGMLHVFGLCEMVFFSAFDSDSSGNMSGILTIFITKKTHRPSFFLTYDYRENDTLVRETATLLDPVLIHTIFVQSEKIL